MTTDPKQNTLIRVEDVKMHFKKGEIKALDGVSLDIQKGDVLVIIGPSGSGKSTPVSYTHLDVYKRQQLRLAVYREVEERTLQEVTEWIQRWEE